MTTVIIIAGPTAVGKTAVAIEVARHYDTEIISADSRQCFREMNIGVARPSVKELSEVPHHFIASHSIHETINAAYFEKYAVDKVEEISQKKNVVVMVGGTGLYLKAFAEGMDAIPEVPLAIHEEIVRNYNQLGMEWLQQEVREKDPVYFERGENKNPQRLMRALEVFKATGQSILSFRKAEKKKRNFRTVSIALQLPMEDLQERISGRVDIMIDTGLEDEVRSLLPYKDLNALQTVGYKEFFSFFDGTLKKEEAIEKIKIATRQYAKRQMTWFKKEKAYIWMRPHAQEVLHGINMVLKND